jgi:hypothetical protein
VEGLDSRTELEGVELRHRLVEDWLRGRRAGGFEADGAQLASCRMLMILGVRGDRRGGNGQTEKYDRARHRAQGASWRREDIIIRLGRRYQGGEWAAASSP